MAEQVPSIGRVVHYVTTSGAHVPADVCAVGADAAVTLFVKDPMSGRTAFEYDVAFDLTGQTPGTWHWPEFVPPKG